MPSYSYICQQCGLEFEKHLSMNVNHEHIKCPNGHTQTERVYVAPRIMFRGSGFYVTDNRKREKVGSTP